MNKQTKNISFLSLFIAIELLMIVIPFLGYIPVGPLRATTLHIPVLIAGIVLGKKQGMILGLIFGMCKYHYQYNPTNINVICLFTFY